MLGNPKTYYTDDEGSFNSKIVQTYFSDNNIRHLITRTRAGVVERVIRTLKADIYKRVENDPSKTWGEYLPRVLTKYNFKDIPSAIKMTPDQATKKNSHFNVHLQLLAHKRMGIIYEPLKIGDKVKIYRKAKFKTQQTSTWSDNTYTINNIEDSHGQRVYKLEG